MILNPSPNYRVRMWDGQLAVQWADETDAQWTARMEEAGARMGRAPIHTVTRRQIRNGRWLTCKL